MTQAVISVPHCLNARIPGYLGATIVSNSVTGVVGAVNGAFTPAGAIIPSTLVDLQAVSDASGDDLGESTAWTATWYSTLADATTAHWDGSVWGAGAAT